MNITKKPSPNIHKGRQGSIPDIIVCHITEGSYTGAVSWLANPESRASTHFVVARDGRVTQLVEIEDTAWGNGTSGTKGDNTWHGHATLQAVRERNINANRYTVSIEHEGRHAETNGALAPAQLESTIKLIAHIRVEVKRIYGFEIPLTRQNIVGHNEITPRTKPHCPGALFPFDEIIRRLHSGNTPSNFAREAWEWAITQNLTDGTNPRDVTTREQMITLLFRYHKNINGGTPI
jgi:N-acetyl-anhydromuramyl-L-alanine amidase AmpD